MTQHTTGTPRIITVPAAQPDDLDSLEVDFSGSSGAIKPVLEEHPQLFWFNGLPTTTREMAVGFHLRAEVNPSLDETMEGMGAKRYIVQHQSKDKNGQLAQKPYWALNWGEQPCSLFVVSYGLQTTWEMEKDPASRLGLAYARYIVKDEQGAVIYKEGTTEPKRYRTLQFRVFIHELVRHGYQDWFLVSLKNTIITDMMKALERQFDVLAAYSAWSRSKGEERKPPYYGFSNPFVPGEPKPSGKDGEGASIYPMVSAIPALPISTRFLTEHLIPHSLLTRIESGLLDETVNWSALRSDEIANGKADPEAVQIQGAAPVPQIAEGADDPLVTEEEAAWIAAQYCGGDSATIAAVCQHYEVATLAQLHKSHYTEMASLVR